MQQKNEWHIAFEISPILSASGSYGDKSGVYRINFNLIKYLSQLLEKKYPKKRIYLYTLSPHLVYNKNLDLVNLLKRDNVELIKLPYYMAPSLMDYPVANLPFIRYFTKIVDQFYIKLLENILFVKYINQINQELKKRHVKIAHHSESGFCHLRSCVNVIHINDLTPILFPFWSRNETIKMHKLKLQFAEQFCQGIVTISENTKQDLIKYFAQFGSQIEEKLRTIYLGAVKVTRNNQPSFKQLNQVILQDQGTTLQKNKYLLYFGTIEPRKNLVTLTTVFSDLKKSGQLKDYKLALVGGRGWGKTHQMVSEFIRQECPVDKDRQMILLDFISDEYLATLIQNSYGVIYIPFYEGFGLPILEAMQYQIPVITSDTSSIPEVGGEAVLYTDPADPGAISRAILKLIADKKLYAQLKKASQKQLSNFSWEKNAQQTLDYYQELMAQHQSK